MLLPQALVLLTASCVCSVAFGAGRGYGDSETQTVPRIYELPGCQYGCLRSGVDINEFLVGIIENFREDMVTGIPDLKVPVLDPFQPRKPIKVDVEDSKAVVHANFTGLRVEGLSGFSMEYLDANLMNLSLNFHLRLPRIYATGNYSLQGMVIKIIPLRGSGGFWVESRNLSLIAKASITRSEGEDGRGRLQVSDDFDVDIDFQKVAIDLENFLGGGRWTEVLKKILNDMSKSLFKKFLPLLKGELNGALRKVINKGLKKLPITDVGTSANDYVDEILKNVRQFIHEKNYDPMQLPDYHSNFSKKIVFACVHGESRLYDGLLYGISSINRTDECVLDSNKTHIYISAHLGLKDLRVSYRGHAKFMNFGPSIQCGGRINEVSFYFAIDQSNKRGAKPNLQELEIVEMSTIWIELSGLGPLTWIMKWLLTGITKLVEGFIVEKVKNSMADYLREELRKFSFPV